MTCDAEFLRRGFPELAQAMDVLPFWILPAGPIIEVIAAVGVPIAGNAAATRWGWLLMRDWPEPWALIEAVEHADGIRVFRGSESLRFEVPATSYPRGGQWLRLSARPELVFVPHAFEFHGQIGGMWRARDLRVGGAIRQREIEFGVAGVARRGRRGNVHVGMVLPHQVVSVEVERRDTTLMPWREPATFVLSGKTLTWATHAVYEGESQRAVLERAKPEIRQAIERRLRQLG